MKLNLRELFFTIIILFILIGLYNSVLKQELPLTAQAPYSDTLIAQTGVADQKIVSIQSYSPHSRIWITSDTHLNSSNFKGNGTIDDPILIENYSITPSSGFPLIHISNTKFYFRIANNLLNGTNIASQGIDLQNVQHGTILNNTVYNNNYDGIRLGDSNPSHNITIVNNTVYNNGWNGIFLKYSHQNVIENNTVHYNTYKGIRLEYSDNNIISDNTIYNHSEDGILLAYGVNSTIIDNVVYNNAGTGITLGNSNHNIITKNSLYKNNFDGVGIYSAHNNEFSMNSVHNNVEIGFRMQDSNNNRFSYNIVYNSGASGISLVNSNSNTFDDNTIHNNDIGVFLEDGAWYNIFSANIIYQNQDEGIYIMSGSYNTIISNTIYENQNYGIAISSGCSDNTIKWNDFLLNNLERGSQGFDEGFTFVFENFWDEWTGHDGDNDGFVDEPYPLDGNAFNFDHSSLTTPRNPDRIPSLPTTRTRPSSSATTPQTTSTTRITSGWNIFLVLLSLSVMFLVLYHKKRS
jgi:parallel beta-helix repeat protein